MLIKCRASRSFGIFELQILICLHNYDIVFAVDDPKSFLSIIDTTENGFLHGSGLEKSRVDCYGCLRFKTASSFHLRRYAEKWQGVQCIVHKCSLFGEISLFVHVKGNFNSLNWKQSNRKIFNTQFLKKSSCSRLRACSLAP